ncbi:MAG: hypothetical protein ACE5IR_07115 [bacterium]
MELPDIQFKPIARKLGMILLLWSILNTPGEGSPLPKKDKLVQHICAFSFLCFRPENNEKTFLEVFCQIPTTSLQLVQSKNHYLGRYQISMALYDLSENQVIGESFIDSIKVKKVDRVRSPKLVRFSFLIVPGDYQAQMRVVDLETQRYVQINKNIHIPDFSESTLSLSDLQMAASITPSAEYNILVKNKRMIVPNIPRILGSGSNDLTLYSEIYNLHYDSEATNKDFIATYTILNEQGDEVKFEEFRYQKPGKSSFITAGISVAELTSGQYELILQVKDLDSTQIARTSTNFLIIRPNLDPKVYSELLAKAFAGSEQF